jgi:hypothetical protein
LHKRATFRQVSLRGRAAAMEIVALDEAGLRAILI